jgi:hypothetical protein|tara:strand:- start:114 stop:497 length:384 start_codon:yes stop_codon:yes gene_type:complete
MPSAKVGNRIFFVLILLMFTLTAVSAAVFLYKDQKQENIRICDSKFLFEEFYMINPSHARTKNVTDRLLSKLLILNGDDSVDQYCASAIKGKDHCIQYFQPLASAGGDVRVCVNITAKKLLSAEFGE